MAGGGGVGAALLFRVLFSEMYGVWPPHDMLRQPLVLVVRSGIIKVIRWNRAKISGLSWGDSSIPCGIYIMPRRRRDTIGMRKLKIKIFLKNTVYR